jgi:hypothetical protein
MSEDPHPRQRRDQLTSMIWRSSAKDTRQLWPPPVSIVAVRWLMQCKCPRIPVPGSAVIS